jgi:hypothetical protein
MEPLSLTQLNSTNSTNNPIPSPSDPTTTEAKPVSAASQRLQRVARTDQDGKRRARQKWTQEETDDLIKGCTIHGVGNWKRCRISLSGRSDVQESLTMPV